MSWTNEMVLYVRHLVNDLSNSPTYDDSRLQDTILTAVQLAKLDVEFANSYTVDLDACILTPDPTEAPRDDDFISLVILKAACIILNAEAKSNAGKAIKVMDGPSTIDMSSAYKATEERAKSVCQDYKEAVLQYQAGRNSTGQAVIGPYVTDFIPPSPWNF